MIMGTHRVSSHGSALHHPSDASLWPDARGQLCLPDRATFGFSSNHFPTVGSSRRVCHTGANFGSSVPELVTMILIDCAPSPWERSTSSCCGVPNFTVIGFDW